MIVAGFGCRGAATVASLRAALALAGGGYAPTALAAPVDKAALVSSLADALGLPMIGVPADALVRIDTPTRSPASLAARGVGSVCEAAALAACGPGAHLLSPRRISPDGRATCAIARGTS